MSIKGQGHSLTLAKGQPGFKIKNGFSQKLLGAKDTLYMQTFETMSMNIYTNEFDHMTKMAAMSTYGVKTLKLLSTRIN